MIKQNYKVNEQSNVLEYLLKYSGMSRNSIKSLLKYDNVLVNGKNNIKYDTIVKINDVISITDDVKIKPRFDIVYEDDDFFVINKPIHLITVGDKNEKSLYNMALDFMKKRSKGKKQELYVLHRLDMETSGIVIFCKNRKLTDIMQKDWNKYMISRIYTLVVEGILNKKKDTIKLYLKDNDNSVVTVCDKDSGKEAITDYVVVKENKNYSLVEANIKTGRKNQIRVSFSTIGHPIVGDKKYYSKINPIKRLAMVANRIEFYHPLNKKKYIFKIDVPKEFNKLI